MYIKAVKRKCNVRGCKSTDCFAISRTREVGNTVIICKSCLGKALTTLDEVDPVTKNNIPKSKGIPPLFFGAKKAEPEESSVEEAPAEESAVEEDCAEESPAEEAPATKKRRRS